VQEEVQRVFIDNANEAYKQQLNMPIKVTSWQYGTQRPWMKGECAGYKRKMQNMLDDLTSWGQAQETIFRKEAAVFLLTSCGDWGENEQRTRGRSYPSQLCKPNYKYGIATWRTEKKEDNFWAKILAHEAGHVVGSPHTGGGSAFAAQENIDLMNVNLDNFLASDGKFGREAQESICNYISTLLVRDTVSCFEEWSKWEPVRSENYCQEKDSNHASTKVARCGEGRRHWRRWRNGTKVQYGTSKCSAGPCKKRRTKATTNVGTQFVNPSLPCVLPFKLAGTWYYDCTDMRDTFSGGVIQSYCSTHTDPDGKNVAGYLKVCESLSPSWIQQKFNKSKNRRRILKNVYHPIPSSMLHARQHE
jgi:hypothetical protein